MIGNAARRAIGFHYFLYVTKFVRRHGGKQVVFDLAAQAPSAVIDAGMVLDVAAGEDLFAQEVGSLSSVEQRHALMVGREYQG